MTNLKQLSVHTIIPPGQFTYRNVWNHVYI